VESNPITKDLITEIDRHIKKIEKQLNERLIHISTSVVVEDFLKGRHAAKVNADLWESLYFAKKWHAQKNLHEEISFDKSSQGYSFFYIAGEVTFDLGVCEGVGGTEWYYLVGEDLRETHKVTGAPVEIKWKAFKHLRKLLAKVNGEANNIDFSVLDEDGWDS
jgi:hypothetical protein